MAHRIGGRKLSRKQGPRLSLFKNLTVSVIRYEKVKTTEAKAKEISSRVEKMITLAKRGDLTARRAVRSPRLASVIIFSTRLEISLALASVVLTFS